MFAFIRRSLDHLHPYPPTHANAHTHKHALVVLVEATTVTEARLAVLLHVNSEMQLDHVSYRNKLHLLLSLSSHLCRSFPLFAFAELKANERGHGLLITT